MIMLPSVWLKLAVTVALAVLEAVRLPSDALKFAPVAALAVETRAAAPRVTDRLP
jgi:hypothetical protein